MPTEIIYLGHQPPQSPAPALPPLAQGDAGWNGQTLLQPTPPLSMPLTHPLPMAPAHYQPVTQPHPAYAPAGTPPMMMVYQPAPHPLYQPPHAQSSFLGATLLWFMALVCVLGGVAAVTVQLAPDRVAQFTTQLHRPTGSSVAATSLSPDARLPSAQNATVRVSVTALTADQLSVSVVNVSNQAFAFASEAVLVRADAVDYGMPAGVPTVQLQPGDDHQIVISPVPIGASLVLRVQVPGAEAVELKVR